MQHASQNKRDLSQVPLKFALGVELLMEHAANYTAHEKNEKVHLSRALIPNCNTKGKRTSTTYRDPVIAISLV